MTERELKLALPDEAAYLALMTKLPPDRIVTQQANYFFDTPEGTLRARKWALRVRREETAGIATHTLTFKGPATIVDGVTSRTEHELPLEAAVAGQYVNDKTIPGHELRQFQAVTGDFLSQQFVLFAAFANQRTSAQLTLAGETLVLELDRTSFENGKTEYELEVEFRDAAVAAEASHLIRALLTSWQIPFAPQPLSKLSRAMRSL